MLPRVTVLYPTAHCIVSPHTQSHFHWMFCQLATTHIYGDNARQKWEQLNEYKHMSWAKEKRCQVCRSPLFSGHEEGCQTKYRMPKQQIIFSIHVSQIVYRAYSYQKDYLLFIWMSDLIWHLYFYLLNLVILVARPQLVSMTSSFLCSFIISLVLEQKLSCSWIFAWRRWWQGRSKPSILKTLGIKKYYGA